MTTLATLRDLPRILSLPPADPHPSNLSRAFCVVAIIGALAVAVLS